VQLDVDDTKVRLYGVRFEANDLGQAEWDRIYAETDQQIADHLRAGQSVVDASRNFRRRERDLARQLATDNGGQPLIVRLAHNNPG